MRNAVTIFTVILALVLIAVPAFSQETTDTDKRISDLEKKVEQLTREKEAPELKLMNNEDVPRIMEPISLPGFYDNGYLVLSSKDGAFRYWLDGRVNLDWAMYEGAENRLPAGFEVRRARLGAKATLFGDWLAEVDIDFADNAIEIKDLWAGYAGLDKTLLKLGNHKSPFGLETLTSSKYITFIERSYIDSWAPDRLLGANYSRWGKSWQFSAGAYGQAGGEFNDKDSLTGGGAGTSQEPSFVGRVTWAPINEEGRLLHVGLASAYMNPPVGKIATSGADLPDRIDAARVMKFDSRAETHVSRAKFLSTGDMKYVDHYILNGIEMAAVLGPVSFQGEYQTNSVSRRDTEVATYVDHDFSGYYAFVTWFPTGDIRPYFVSEGEFGRIYPKHKWGAVELALRYSTLDLNDITTTDAIKGGSAENITLGVNWYINPNHRIMFNVTSVNNDEFAKPGKDWAPIPPGTGTSLTPVYGDDFTTISMRYQIAF